MYTHSNLKTLRVVKWKTNTKYHNVETVSKSNGQIIETEAKLIPLTHMYTHDHSLTHICTHMTVH